MEQPTPSTEQLRRQGLAAYAALQQQMRDDIGDATDLPTAQAAALRAARRAWEQGWASGPIWLAAGPQLLLLDWAVSRGVRIQHTDQGDQANPGPFRLED
jgi:hypothetical protein